MWSSRGVLPEVCAGRIIIFKALALGWRVFKGCPNAKLMLACRSSINRTIIYSENIEITGHFRPPHSDDRLISGTLTHIIYLNVRFMHLCQYSTNITK